MACCRLTERSIATKYSLAVTGPRAASSQAMRWRVVASKRPTVSLVKTSTLGRSVPVGYRLESSPAIIASGEAARYEQLPTAGPDARRPRDQEDRHLIDRVQRFALRIDRMDALTLGVGLEAPLEPRDAQTTLSPLLEWTLEVPVDRRGVPCVPSLDPGADGCLTTQGFGAFRQRLGLGLRVLPPLRGVAITVALEIVLTGVHAHVRELAAQDPYRVLLGFAYTYDSLLPVAH